MNCKKVQSLLTGYIDAVLEQSERDQVEAHLVRCEECRQKRTLLTELITEIHQISDIEIPDMFASQIVSKVFPVSVTVDRAVSRRLDLLHRVLISLTGVFSLLFPLIGIVVLRTLFAHPKSLSLSVAIVRLALEVKTYFLLISTTFLHLASYVLQILQHVARQLISFDLQLLPAAVIGIMVIVYIILKLQQIDHKALMRNKNVKEGSK